MITKSADILLQEHQQRVLDKLRDENLHGLIAYHSVGSGKTLTALKALEEAKRLTGKKGLFIAPASLVSNVQKEIDKHHIPLSSTDLDVFSYEKASRNADKLLESDYGMTVLDEAHKMRNSGTNRVQALQPVLDKSGKILMLTGTAGYNHPADMLNLTKLIDHDLKVPVDPKEFEQKFVDNRWRLRNKGALTKSIGKYIDVYQRPQSTEDFPSVREEIVRVPMSSRQNKVYKYVEDTIPVHLRTAVRKNIPMSLRDAANLNMFATGVRQASVSPMHHDVAAVPEDSPKLVEAARRMAEAAKTPRFRGVAYSNFLDAGLTPYTKLLQQRGLHPLVFTGALNAKAKKELVDTFNQPTDDPRVLLVSSSGGEGLDLKGVRKLQILEPHFNKAKIDQVIGRGARYQSHTHLPPNERTMSVEQYQSTMPKTLWQTLLRRDADTAIDGYLYDASVKKQQLIDELKDTLS